ncbi:MAG: hypothetical protein KDK39_15955 [Leptospiraceae bacterium]|nr:hypothetical protein [Leptospiraceae bacterium]
MYHRDHEEYGEIAWQTALRRLLKPLLLIAAACTIALSVSCYGTDANPTSHMRLALVDHWQISMDRANWQPTRTEPWEFVHPELSKNDGIGWYRLEFSIPAAIKKRIQAGAVSALFIPCIDDADVSWLNGVEIGRTGRFDRCHPAADVRSAARENRVYPLPPHLILEGANTLEIEVCDMAGLGGFCYAQTPLIMSLSEAHARERQNRIRNDLPHSLGLFAALALAMLFGLRFVGRWRKLPTQHRFKLTLQALGRFMIQPLIVFRPPGPILSAIDVAAQHAIQYLIASVIALGTALFLLTQITWKYFIDSEFFWYSAPTIGFAVSLILILMLFHSDSFGASIHVQGRAGLAWRRLLAALTHPWLLMPFLGWMLYLLTQYEPGAVWNVFQTVLYLWTALIVMLVILSSLMLLSNIRRTPESAQDTQKNGNWSGKEWGAWLAWPVWHWRPSSG